MLQGKVVGYDTIAKFNATDLANAAIVDGMLLVASNLGEVPIDPATVEDEFSAAFLRALPLGHIKFSLPNFEGWQEECTCERCRLQKVIVDYLWPVGEVAE